MKKIIYICLIALISFSCSVNEDNVLFDPINGQTLVNFATPTADLPILLNGTGSVDIQVEVTTISTEDRIFNFNINEDQTTADPANYTLGQAIVPANSFLGTLTIEGVDVTVEVTPETLVLEFVEENGIVTDIPIIVSVFQVCPVDDDLFIGDYMAVSSGDPAVIGASTCFAVPDGPVTINSKDGLSRTFEFNYLFDCNFGTFTLDLDFQLVCDQIVVSVDTGTLACGGPPLLVATGDPQGVYDSTNDNMFTITLTDDVDAVCGTTTQQTVTLTKM